MHINYDNGTMFWETLLKIALCLIKFGEYQSLLSFINHFNLFIKRQKKYLLTGHLKKVHIPIILVLYRM